MLIDVESVKQEGNPISVEFVEIPLDDDFPLPCELKAPVKVMCDCSVVGNELNLSGNIEATVSMPCARCLDDVSVDMSLPFAETISLLGADEDDYFCDGVTFNMDKLVLDVIFQGMPVRVLCGDDCKGLCPKCGTDLNHSSCACVSDDDVINPFLNLKGLFDDKEV